MERSECDIEMNVLDEDGGTSGIIQADPLVGYQPFSLYKELRIIIKCSLTCSRTASPLVKINMPFDILLFNGGLKGKGIPSNKRSGSSITS